jgi:O-antigen ligase
MVINNTKIARAALYVFMFSINFEMFNLVGGAESLSIGRITGFLYFSVLIYLKYRLNIYRFKHLFYALIIFLVVIAVSSVLHLNHLSWKIIDISILQDIVLFFLLLIHERNNPGVLEKSLYAFVLGTVLLTVFYLFGIGIEITGGRLSLFGDNENTVGLRMGIASIVLIYSVFMTGKKISWKRYLMIVPVPLMLKVMLETGSRVSFISFVLMIAVMLAFYLMAHPVKRIMPTLIFVGIAFYLLIPYLFSNVVLIDRLWAAKEGNLAGREDIWPAYLHHVWQSPILGYGFSGFEEVGTHIFGFAFSPHNVIIEILLYGGLIALVAFGWFFFQVVFNGFRMYLSQKEYIGLVLMISYVGSFLSGQVLVTKLMWFILAFNCILLSHKRSNEKNLYPNPSSMKITLRHSKTSYENTLLY